MEEAIEIRTNWLNTYQGIKKWQERNAELASETGRSKSKAKDAEGIDSVPYIRIPKSGMKRILTGDLNKVTVRCNTPIQGAGAAILKTALGDLWPLVKEAGEDNVKIAAAIHDELLLLVSEPLALQWANILRYTMEKAESIWLGDIPALAETSIGKTWSEVH
jgi:DNA polymerase I-like protein with 3'-5' exonuclease and polymerase domains